MRQIDGYKLWIGNAGDARNVSILLAADIVAIVDLATSEPIAMIPREMVYLRIPLSDGAGNPHWLLRTAVDGVAGLLRSEIPTLVCCGAGMSRSPSIAAAALAVVRACPLDQALAEVCRDSVADVSPGLWSDLSSALHSGPKI